MLASAAAFTCTSQAARTPAAPPAGRMALEFRCYNLRPGSRDAFHRLVTQALPMLRRHDIDVVAYGPSAHDEASYFLVRAFDDLADRARKEDAFYGSEEWKTGLREPVLALIESYTTVVLELDATAVEALRRETMPAAARAESGDGRASAGLAD